MNLSVKPFTLVGATTRFGMVSPPLSVRFGSVQRLDFYDDEAMRTIVRRSARILDIQVQEDGVEEIARLARHSQWQTGCSGASGTSRRLMADNVITTEVAPELCHVWRSTSSASTTSTAACCPRSSRSSTAAQSASTPCQPPSADSAMDVYEPYLLHGFLDRNILGRPSHAPCLRASRHRIRHRALPIERPGDMVAILTQLRENDVPFIDEVHRLSRVVEEVLYPAMEDGFVSWVIDKGLKARSMNLSVKPFTLVGATTRFGMVSPPLRDRFGSVHRLDFYDDEAMRTIVRRSARPVQHILDIQAEDDGVEEIARRSRGTPRVANRLLRRVRDFAQVMADNVITTEVARERSSVTPGGRPPRPRRHRPPRTVLHHREVRRRPCWPQHPVSLHQRRLRHHRGRVRAIPAPARLPRPHQPRPSSHVAAAPTSIST